MLLIFDWDGTLIDSSQKIIDCMHRAAETSGMPKLSDQTVKGIIGLGMMELIGTLYPDSEQEDKERFRDHYSKHYVEADQIPCDFFPGVMDTLEGLKTQGHQLAVATGKSRRGLSRVMTNTQLSNFFDGSRCADETRSKPHPLMLEELLLEFSCDPDQALMVGDTVFDMEMAQRANMPRIAVSYGAHHHDELSEFDPKAIIHHFPEIKQHI